MSNDDLTEAAISIIFLALGFVLAGSIFNWGNFDDAKELGQAICDQEYNQDFKSYNNAELKCKPKETKNETLYDGIVIQVGGG